MACQGPFTALSGSTVLVRMPLLPAVEHDHEVAAENPLLAEGRFLASRHDGMNTVGGREAEQVRSSATLRAYELRARFRPTPHGVFAGVAPARIGETGADLRLGSAHRVRTRPSSTWLSALAAQLVDHPEVLRLLTLTSSNVAVRRGQRLEHEQQATPGVAGPQRISIRATDACALILCVCQRGACYPEVVAEVARKWPWAPEEKIRANVLELVRAGFLLTDLLPEGTHEDPLGHVLGKLPASVSLRQPVQRLRDHLRLADRSPPATSQRLAELRSARSVCDELAYVERPLSADVAADAHIEIPASVAQDAAEALGVLWRVSHPRDSLADYHRRFIERYGTGRFVPLLEVADPAIGLGDIDTDSEGDALPADRGTVMAELLTRAVADDWMEVELDEATIDALDRHPSTTPPPSAEVYARVVATGDNDRPAGRLSLAIYGGGTQQAGSTLGRFVSLLPEAHLEPTGQESALLAELAVQPRTPELAGIASPTGFVPRRIPVGVPPRDHDLDLDTLLLVSNGERLMLWSREHDREVLPVFYSRIGPRYIPPLARVLHELSMQGCRPWHGWSWAPLQHTPFQPRLRYKQTILSPARWRLPLTLTRAAGDRAAWGSALQAWQETTSPSPPETVVVDEADRHLPLNLRRATDRELLRRYVRRGVATVTEQPGGSETAQAVVSGPTGRHALELVIPLTRRSSGTDRPPPAARTRPIGDGLHLPGGQWLSVAIPAPTTCHEAILRRLGEFATTMARHVDRWFWLRYNNAAHGPHVRARFHGTPTTLGGTVLPALSAWCAELITQRLAHSFTLEPYDPEIERYGGDQTIEAAERVFDTDSRLVLATLTAAPDTEDRLVVAALSAATIARTLTGSDLSPLNGRHVDRTARRRVAQLRPRVRTADQSDAAIAAPIRPAWRARDAALLDYRTRLPEVRRADCASSLIHMHTNRILGDRDSERIARALAADLLAREASQASR